MDRTTRKDADARTMRIDLPDADAYLPPSRQAILDRCCTALDGGPILLTGDAGIGKSWAVAELTRRAWSARWLTIDLTPSDGPTDLYRHLARGLGLGLNAPSRPDIADALAERASDGDPFALVIDEAQNLTLDVWEEVRVLLNRLGADDGFAHLVLVGQTALVRRFSTRPMAAIEARLAAHIHLRPLDVAEAQAWLAHRHPGHDWSDARVEAIHRDAGGNPRRLIRYALAVSQSLAARPAHAPANSTPASRSPGSNTGLDGFAPNAMISDRPSLTAPQAKPNRPPLHVEENSIEVGWSADDADSSLFGEEDADAANAPAPVGAPPVVEESEQAVHDHYAALQAWREWASNQDKRTQPERSDRDLADEIDEAAATDSADQDELPVTDRSTIRAEGYQHFAPFGQLFTRMAPVRES